MLYRNIIDSLYNSRLKEAKRSQATIKEVAKDLQNKMVLAGAVKEYGALKDVLEAVFLADKKSIVYLKTFALVLEMALRHTEQFSDRVNVNQLQTKMLKRTLNEMVEEDIGTALGCVVLYYYLICCHVYSYRHNA